MNMLLKPVKPKKISDQVYDQLRELIARGVLKPGEQITPERELSEALNVSRTSVRNAIGKLVATGLLEHRQGQGTFVRKPGVENSGPLAAGIHEQDMRLEDLLEVRMGLECNSAALAAQRAVEEDIFFMRKSIEEMEAEVRSGGQGTEADVSFHMAIAYATKNPVQIYIMRSFYDLLFYGIKANLFYLYQDTLRIETIIEQHQAIFKAISKHAPQEAYNAMKSHIGYVLDFFKTQSTTPGP